MTRFSPFKTTLWYETAAPAVETKELEGTLKADVCIVGGATPG